MQLSPQQESAIKAMGDWFTNQPDNQIFYLAGYAGTGKTTLTSHFVESIDGDVLYAAYTGKAALRMQQSGCKGATTIHSLTYHLLPPDLDELKDVERQIKSISANADTPELRALLAKKRELLQPNFKLNEESPIKDAELLILDECSMIDAEMAKDILSFNTKILVLGDPGQLPPVRGEGFFTAREPDAFLTEIHRQALDSPIIALSKQIRETGDAPFWFSKEASRMKNTDYTYASLGQKFDQIICGTNNNRRRYNLGVRESRGIITTYPIKGESLICLKNDSKRGLLNGMFAEVTGSPFTAGSILDADEHINNFSFEAKLLLEFGDTKPRELILSSVPFLEYADSLAAERVPWYMVKDTAQFDFGYAITCHKSQGSEWDNVAVIDDGLYTWGKTADPVARKRWLYTAVTRAKQKVHIIQQFRKGV